MIIARGGFKHRLCAFNSSFLVLCIFQHYASARRLLHRRCATLPFTKLLVQECQPWPLFTFLFIMGSNKNVGCIFQRIFYFKTYMICVCIYYYIHGLHEPVSHKIQFVWLVLPGGLQYQPFHLHLVAGRGWENVCFYKKMRVVSLNFEF